MHSQPARVLAAALLVLVASLVPLLPASASSPGNSAFERTWNRTDKPVSAQQVNRTWMWGPQPFTGPLLEMSSDLPDAGRQVQYFDKSRMEITVDASVNEYSVWYVTNGLLARELVSGQLQLGNNDFETREPAQVNVAGDWDDPTGPTYATFGNVLTAPALESGTAVTARLSRDGTVADEPELAGRGVFAAAFVPETGHTVASPFWEFMTSSGLVQEQGPARTGPLFPNAFYATGYPISEAYWANVKVAGTYTDVLVQVFERRVLTFTPDNPQGWQVEAGNVGRHYFEWRYGISAPQPVDAAGSGFARLGPTPLPEMSAGLQGQTSITIANMSPEPLNIGFAGAGEQVVEADQIEGCPECQTLAEPPDSCHPEAPTRTFTVPPGSYAVTLTRQVEGGTLYQSGIWTLLPDSMYGACFFTIR